MPLDRWTLTDQSLLRQLVLLPISPIGYWAAIHLILLTSRRPPFMEWRTEAVMMCIAPMIITRHQQQSTPGTYILVCDVYIYTKYIITECIFGSGAIVPFPSCLRARPIDMMGEYIIRVKDRRRTAAKLWPRFAGRDNHQGNFTDENHVPGCAVVALRISSHYTRSSQDSEAR